MMPKTRHPGNGVRHRIRSVALLLPAPLRYDWQHSSSQLPIIFSDARWTSSPSGRYYLRGMHDIAPPNAKNAPLPFPFGLKFAQPIVTGGKCMRPAHGCHSYPALLRDALPDYIHTISRATISSSQRPRQDWQPLLLPGCQSISATPTGSPPPVGVAFCTAPIQPRMAIFTFVANRPGFGQNFAKISA